MLGGGLCGSKTSTVCFFEIVNSFSSAPVDETVPDQPCVCPRARAGVASVDLPLVTGPFTSVEQLQVRCYVELKSTESSIPRVEARGHLAAASYLPCAAARVGWTARHT